VADSGVIRIGSASQTTAYLQGIYTTTTISDPATGVAVYVDQYGNLAITGSSQRFKKDIQDMGSASDAVLALRPVAFHYKADLKNTQEYGLVAEEVAKVSPDLVIRDKNGQPYTVRYEAVNAMLLNEFKKQHEEVESQKKVIADLKTEIATLTAEQKDIEALKAQFTELQKAVAAQNK
jgi:hypothetical protein